MHDKSANSKSDFYQTPNLEKLTDQGVRFTDAYARSPVCSPTRYRLQTGKSPAALRWTKASPTVTAADGYEFTAPTLVRRIDSNETTIGEIRLFGLSQDIGEQHDLSAVRPERSKELLQRLDAYLENVDAQYAAPNPNHDPNREPTTKPRGKGNKAGEKRGRRTG